MHIIYHTHNLSKEEKFNNDSYLHEDRSVTAFAAAAHLSTQAWLQELLCAVMAVWLAAVDHALHIGRSSGVLGG